jgi:hypothetical protein
MINICICQFALVCGSLQQFRKLQKLEIQVELQDKLPAYSKLQLQFSYNCWRC